MASNPYLPLRPPGAPGAFNLKQPRGVATTSANYGARIGPADLGTPPEAQQTGQTTTAPTPNNGTPALNIMPPPPQQQIGGAGGGFGTAIGGPGGGPKSLDPRLSPYANMNQMDFNQLLQQFGVY